MIETLTSWAGAFCEAGLFSHKETNELRIMLNELQCFTDRQVLSVIHTLQINHSEFLAQLINYYGTMNFARNITRLAMKRMFEETLQEVHKLGCEVLPRVQLLFNRPVHQYVGDDCVRLSLYSTVLLDYLETIEDTIARTNFSIDTVSHLVPSEGEGPASLDEKVAKACGFDRGLDHCTTFLSHDIMAKDNFIIGVQQLVATTEELVGLIKKNAVHNPLFSQLVFLFDNINMQIHTLQQLKLPLSEDLEIWENKRLTAVLAMTSLLENLRSMVGIVADLISDQGKAPSKSVEQNVPLSSKRRLKRILMENGIASHEAEAATTKLLDYCVAQKVRPADLIEAELTQFHKGFGKKAFEFLQSQDQDFALQNRSSHEKHRNMERLTRLGKVFCA